MATLSKYSYVEYECRAKRDLVTGQWKLHTHQVQLGDGVEDFGYSLEDAALELAERVRLCDSSQHDGHGYLHDEDEAALAFRAAIDQLTTRDFDAEWQEREHARAMFKKWGGHMPATVLFYDQDGNERFLVPDQHGNPMFGTLKRGTLSDLGPRPTKKNAYPDKQGIGWRARRFRRSRRVM